MKLIVSIRSEALVAALLGYAPRLVDRLQKALQRLAIDIQSAVKGQKLSGQVLHVRTGTLRRSINQAVETRSDGVWAIVGTPVVYARVHEYGFQGTEAVRAHLRTIRQVWGRPISPKQIEVSAHARRVNLPERSFLRSTLRDFETRAKEAIARAATEALVR